MAVLSFHGVQLTGPTRAGRYPRRPGAKPAVLVRCGIAEPSGEPAPLGQKTRYNDGIFEKAFMTLFARKMEKFASAKPFSDNNKKKGSGWWDCDYESFVDVSKRVMQGRSRLQQQQVVREVLLSMLPPGAPAQFRKLFPPTKWAAEFNAALTVPFFHWLVGPSEVVEKCRYLENSGFFTNEFGLPLTMIPNFEDMSCEMVYGQAPPPFEEDPASKQACYAEICTVANPNSPVCPKLQA
ncbi:hypothetical protein K1719_027750 [Acacia pycnantha]|nr:hypothetical protein K1719_027750 [Acacia pycnantha]